MAGKADTALPAGRREKDVNSKNGNYEKKCGTYAGRFYGGGKSDDIRGKCIYQTGLSI